MDNVEIRQVYVWLLIYAVILKIVTMFIVDLMDAEVHVDVRMDLRALVLQYVPILELQDGYIQYMIAIQFKRPILQIHYLVLLGFLKISF